MASLQRLQNGGEGFRAGIGKLVILLLLTGILMARSRASSSRALRTLLVGAATTSACQLILLVGAALLTLQLSSLENSTDQPFPWGCTIRFSHPPFHRLCHPLQGPKKMYCRSPSLPRTDKVIMLTRWLSGFLGSRWGFNHFLLSFSLAENLPAFFFVAPTFPDLRHFVGAKAPQAGTECQCCSGTKCCWREHTSPPVGIKVAGTTTWTPTFPAFVNFWVFHAGRCRMTFFKCLPVVDQMSFRVKSPSCWNLPKCYQVRMTTIQTPWIVLLSPVSCGYWWHILLFVDWQLRWFMALDPETNSKLETVFTVAVTALWPFLVEQVPSERWR